MVQIGRLIRVSRNSGLKKRCDTLFYSLHGNIFHFERHDTFKQFTKVNSKQGLLFVTTDVRFQMSDVSARGLNLPAVDWILDCTK